MTTFRTGQEVINIHNGQRGIVSDGYIKKAGQHKGTLDVVWIGCRYGAESASPEDLALVTAPKPLEIPEGLVVLLMECEEVGAGAIRIEVRQYQKGGAMTPFGEVAYWHTDGTNDIMQGEKGTLNETIQALVDFTK